MIDRWRLGPWWLLSLTLGLYFAAVTLIADLVFDRSSWNGDWTGLVVAHLLGGAVFGAVMGPVTARKDRQEREAVGADRQDHRRASAALRGRGVPPDARVRELAVRLGERRLAEMHHQQWASVVVAALLVLALLAAVLDSPWWLLGVLALAAVLAMSWWEPRRLRRRLAALTDA